MDLTPFCSVDPYRPNIHRPFTWGDHTYATNGRILIRVAKREDGTTVEYPSKDRCEKILTVPDAVQFVSLRGLQFPPEPESEVDCEACKGRGNIHDCPDCECGCSECGGTGTAKIWRSVLIDSVNFDVKYIIRIGSLPGIEIARPAKYACPMPFRFSEGIGVIIGPRSPYTVDLGDIEKYREAHP